MGLTGVSPVPDDQSTDKVMITRGGGGAAFDAPAPIATRVILLVILAAQGFTLAINGVAAPWMMRSFGLDQTGMARAFAWVATSAIGAFAIARAADRIGRRKVVRFALLIETVAALSAAFARSLAVFIPFDLVVISAAGAVMTCTVVWLAELSSSDDRARWQALGGFAVIAGSGPCILLMPHLGETVLSWRVLFLLVAATPLLIPLLPPDRTAGTSPTTRSHDSLGDNIPNERNRKVISVTLIATTIISTIASGSVEAWRYFHMVADAGIAPGSASWALIVAGLAGVVGFPVGAFLSSRFDRIGAIVMFQLVLTGAIVWAFWGPPGAIAHPLLWIAAGLALVSASMNGVTVAANTAIAELYPAGLRATIFGSLYVAGSLGRVLAHVLVAVITSSHVGVATAVGALGLLGIPSAILLALFVRDPRRTQG